MQVKVTLDQEIYEYLKTNSQQHRRTLSAELNTILEQHIKGPGMSPTPALHYPEGVRSPIPETPYKITAQQSQSQSQSQSQPQPEKPKRKSIIGNKPHPLLWLDENDIDPNDISETAYNKLHTYYPDVDITQFINYQHDRQNRYVPDPNDPFDPIINNPYLRNK